MQSSLNFQVFFFILPETTSVVLTNVLLEKFHESEQVISEPQKDLVQLEEGDHYKIYSAILIFVVFRMLYFNTGSFGMFT